MYFFCNKANGERATKTCGFFLCSISFDDVNITVKPWGGAKISTDVYNCPFYSFLFSAELLLNLAVLQYL